MSWLRSGLVAFALLAAPSFAWAQCNLQNYALPPGGGLLLGNCTLAVNPVSTDLLQGWQGGNAAGTRDRAFTLAQIQTFVLGGGGGGGPFLPLTGGTVTGSLAVIGNTTLTGTLGVTGTAAIGGNTAITGTLGSTGTASFGTGSAAWITATGGASATLGTGGTGNLTLNLRSAGTGTLNIGGSAFSAVQIFPAVSNGGILQITQPTTASNLIGFTTSNLTTGGFNFTAPLVFTKTVAYTGDRASSILNRPFTLSQTVTGTSNNQSGFGINLISTALSNYQSYAGTRALDILITSGANTTAIPMVGLHVASQQAAAPATVAALAWQINHAYSPVGTLVVNGINLYQLTVAGTSAGAGGPTGTGGAIVDGTCTWAWQDFASDVYRNITGDFLAGSNFANGATTIDNATGNQWGMIVGSFLGTSAQHYSQSVVMELDDNVQGSVNRSVAFQIAKEGNQGDVYDYGVWVTAIGASTRYRNMFVATNSTDPNGVVFSVSDQFAAANQTMAGVFDCLMCTPTGTNNQAGWFVTGGGGYILRSANAQWLGTGNLQLGNASFAISANTLTIDTTYQLLTAVGALAGGTDWTTGDLAVDDFGNVGAVTAVAGVPTVLAIAGKQKTYVATASVPGGVVNWWPMHTSSVTSATGGRRQVTGFTTATETYSAGTTLSLGTGAATTINIGRAASTTTITGTIKAGASTGVSCGPGVPTVGFTTVNGLVTAC